MTNITKNQSSHSVDKDPDTPQGAKYAFGSHCMCVLSWNNNISILETKLE